MNTRSYDTHCHLDAAGNDRDAAGMIAEAAAVGVAAIMLPAVEPANWDACIQIAQAHPTTVRLALGIHPQAVRDLTDDQIDDALDRLPDLLRAHGAMAVGEVGLDHRWDTDPAQRARQLKVFTRQLDIAHQLALPPLMHCLNAYDPLLQAWKKHPARRAGVPGVMHSYSGSADMVPLYVREGLYISFGGAVTWTHAKRTPAACAATPADRLLIETDAPYQPPHPLDDRPCRPAQIPLIAATMATLRSTTPDAILALTWDNAARLFDRM
jgi:TatD DNase family protein